MAISLPLVSEVVKKLLSSKAPGVDEIGPEKLTRRTCWRVYLYLIWPGNLSWKNFFLSFYVSSFGLLVGQNKISEDVFWLFKKLGNSKSMGEKIFTLGPLHSLLCSF